MGNGEVGDMAVIDVLDRAQAWLQAADERGINVTDENGYLAVIADCVDDGTRHDAEVDDGVGRLMAWYTTDHARRDAERQALRRQQAGLLDKAQTSKQVARYECIHCRALYSHTDERCPRCGAYEAVRSKTPNVEVTG
jgi:rubrerythrin